MSNFLQRLFGETQPRGYGNALDMMFQDIERAPLGASRVGQRQAQVTAPAPGGFDPVATTVPAPLARQGVTQGRADQIEAQAFDAAMNFAGTTPIAKMPLYKGQEAAARLNFRLREGLPLSADDLAAMREIESMLRPSDRQMLLWRGVRSGPYARARVGQQIVDPAFMSTADDFAQAAAFGGRVTPDAAVLGFRVPRGSPLADLSGFGEREFVLPRGQKWMVEEILRRPDVNVPIVRLALPQ